MGWEMSMFSVKVPPKIYNKKKITKNPPKIHLKELIWSSISSFDYLGNVEVPPKKPTKKKNRKSTKKPPKIHRKLTENPFKISPKTRPIPNRFEVEIRFLIGWETFDVFSQNFAQSSHHNAPKHRIPKQIWCPPPPANLLFIYLFSYFYNFELIFRRGEKKRPAVFT